MDDIRNRDVACLHGPLEHLLDRCTASLDRHELLAEVDRLTAAGFVQATLDEGAMRERTRILAIIDGLDWSGCGGWGCDDSMESIADDLIAAIDGRKK